jgi:hypothetical protein
MFKIVITIVINVRLSSHYVDYRARNYYIVAFVLMQLNLPEVASVYFHIIR